MANPILRIKRGSSTPASLSSGELAIDLTNLNLFVGKADGTPLAIGGSGTFATKAYADAAVSTANTALTAAIAAEEAARIAADNTLTSDLATETSNRTSADTALDGKITTEKNRIDAILSAADADKDSFAEIVSLINSVDTANDSAFAGYVTSNNAALAQEVTDRTNADAALGIRIDGVESDATGLEARVTTAESDIVSLGNDIVAEETARIAAVSAEASSRASADTTLQSNIDAEATTRANADSALDSRATDLETKTQNITATANITTVTGVMQNENGSNVVDFGTGRLTFSGSQDFGAVNVNDILDVGGDAFIGYGQNGGNLSVGGNALIEGNATFNGNIVGDGSTEIQNCIIDGGVY